jgi:hypothetical protein
VVGAAQAKLEYLVVVMVGPSAGPKSMNKVKSYLEQTNCHELNRQGAYMINTSQELKFHKSETDSTVLSSHFIPFVL